MPDLPEPGQTYAGFALRRVLGDGTFARVYEATSDARPDPVALKVSRVPVDSEETALRALREIRILGSMSNPHVVHIYDHGLGPDERWYMSMELLRGQTLTDTHDFSAPMRAAEAVRIVREASLGLAEAHRAGVVHRDVKPDNLWVTPDRHIKVLDFGLARAWDMDSTIAADATTGHMLIGTPHYAQPEQVLSGKLTPASDVYSLGMILYELLSARVPLFPNESLPQVRQRLANDPLTWLRAHVKQPVVPLDEVPGLPRLPRTLIDLVHRTLAKEPAERPPTAGALANELARTMNFELGGEAAAILETWELGGKRQAHLVPPGVHKIGTSLDCDIRLPVDGPPTAHAILEWAGSPREAELQPLVADGTLRINGHVIDYRVRLVPGTRLLFGRLRAELRYPASRPA